jgi:hypothetical protein
MRQKPALSRIRFRLGFFFEKRWLPERASAYALPRASPSARKRARFVERMSFMPLARRREGQVAAIRLAFACLLCGAIAWACSGEPPQRGRVFLIGIDGAAPRVIDAMMEQGRLPHLASLAKEGAYGRLRSAKPISSPRIWNTIATGKVPEKHGILHFSRKNADDQHELFLSTDRKVPSLWSIASQAGRRVGVVNFWNTFPPEKINGVMVSDHVLATEIAGRELMVGASQTAPGSIIYPAAWHERLYPLVGISEPLTRFSNPFADGVTLPDFARRDELTRHFFEDASLMRMSLEITRELDPDLLMLLMPGIDRVSHFLWGVLEPNDKYPEPLKLNPEERAGGKQALLDYYAYSDALIGELLALTRPEDLVMVVSDHGFEAGHVYMALTGTHESHEAIDGIVFARGPGVTPGTRIEGMSIADVTPTILAWMGLPVADDMDGRVAGLVGVDTVARIATHNTVAVEFVRTAPSGVETDIVEQLRTLGYIDPDDDGAGADRDAP